MGTMQSIHVYWNHLSGANLPEPMGVLTVQSSRGHEVFAFEFDSRWLTSHPHQPLDPELQLYGGAQFSPRRNFGIFLDSSPDRWGRKLMLRREAIRAREARQSPRPLSEADFLLGVYDETRMGALRFKRSPDGDFLNDDRQMAAPPWARLRELEEASRHLEDERLSDDHGRWLAMLFAPGSSLGGARPKASVLSPEGDLWIAKFPRKNDAWNTGAWECLTARMAKDAGVRIPEFRLEQFSSLGATFLTKRFDRAEKQRIHFASAMTLLGKTDGDDAAEGASYLELAEWMTKHCVAPQADLREMWRRIVFSIAVSNTDDHLRNHGFLLEQNGWSLSPAYDLNPNPQGLGLSLNISQEDNRLDLDLAREVAPYFRLDEAAAETIIAQVCATVRNWRKYASHLGIPRSEQDEMAPAFARAEDVSH